MSAAFTGMYQDWEEIDYRPALETLKPEKLLDYLAPGDRALNIGCNSGAEAIFLAQHGIDVLGIDINQQAIESARTRADCEGLASHAIFEAGDFLTFPLSDQFKAVLLIRVLTCIPQAEDWHRMLHHAWLRIAQDGLLYVRDFLLSPDSPAYAQRYATAATLGWRDGNFLVADKAGEPLFVAHHHSGQEVQSLIAPYQCLVYSTGESLSMNGNVCRMFEFVGRKFDSTS